MRTALDANDDRPLIWWIMIDHGTPEENLDLVQRIWLEQLEAPSGASLW